MSRQYGHNKQAGAVLLTCLVFLLILLGMLRFVVGSAKLEEEKAGIDLEIVTAREAAESAIAYAEYFILKQGELYCDATVSCDRAKSDDVGGSANLVFRESNADLAKRNQNYIPSGNSAKGMEVASIADLLNKGIYTGDFLRSGGYIGQCNPLWICVNWGASAGAVNRSADARSKPNQNLASIACDACNISATQAPRFIIERYTEKELEAAGLAGLDQESVVFRITAVGFGQGSGNNLTNVMLQSTYVLPK